MTPDYWSDAIAALSAADPVMARLIAAYPAEALVSRDDPFGTLARSIVGQQISVVAASSVWARLEREIGAVAPATLGAATDDSLLGCGLSRQKTRYLKGLASQFLCGALDPADWHGRDDEALIADLTKHKGIGRWTAEMFLMFHLMRPDVLPLDDIGLQRATGLHYGAGGKLAKAAIGPLAEAWRPWRSVATWYLWRSLDPIPVTY